MKTTNVKLLGDIGALPPTWVGDKGQYAHIPKWMMKDHNSGDVLHFEPKFDSQREALSQPEFKAAVEMIRDGFCLLAAAKERAIRRIVQEECQDERRRTTEDEVEPLQERNTDLRKALEGLLGAVQGGDIEAAKQAAYDALANRGEG